MPETMNRQWRVARLVEPGEYTVTLEAVGKKLVRKAVIRYRQDWTVGPTPIVLK